MKRIFNNISQSFSSTKKFKQDDPMSSPNQLFNSNTNGNTITAPMISSSSDDELDGFVVVKTYPPPHMSSAPLNAHVASQYKPTLSASMNFRHRSPLDGVRLVVRSSETSRISSATQADIRRLELLRRGPDFDSLEYDFTRELIIISESIK
jgi:hypothetical protein